MMDTKWVLKKENSFLEELTSRVFMKTVKSENSLEEAEDGWYSKLNKTRYIRIFQKKRNKEPGEPVVSFKDLTARELMA